MVTFLIFIIGTVIGSFLNVLVDRLPAGRNVLNDRSVCDSCHKQLKWFELIPLVSYTIQHGKCRHCHASIPFRVFFVELLTGVLFAFVFFKYSSTLPIYSLIIIYGLIACLLVIFFADWIYGIIPDQILIVMLVLAVLFYTPAGLTTLFWHLLIGFLTFLGFLLLFIATRGQGIGFGDVKFAFVIGFLLGFPGALLAVYFAFLTGGIISLILVIGRRKKFKKDTIAFGPFLVTGIVLFVLLQGVIMQYLHSNGL